jgi:C4-dicarboxylate-binding protein DctP
MSSLIASLAAAAMLAAGTAGAEAKTTLRLTLQLPLKGVLGQNVQMFKEEVEKATKGEIEIQIFDSGSLYQDKDVPKAVGSGQIEMGVASLARYVGDVPAVDVFYIPALFDTDSKLRAAVAPGSPVRGPLDAAMAKTGAKVLWWQAYGSTILLTKGEPLRSPDELKGKKVRVFGKLLGTWVQANGGSPVNVAGSEQYFAYQRGTVDIGMTAPDTIKTRKMWEVMKSVTLAGQAAVEFVVVINDKAWAKLSAAQQKIVADAAVKAEKSLRDQFETIAKESIEAGKANGMTIHIPQGAEAAKWRASADAVRDAFLAGAGPLGKQVYEAAAKLK